jgi:hypothetical protein
MIQNTGPRLFLSKFLSRRSPQPLFEGGEFSIKTHETSVGMDGDRKCQGEADHEGHGDDLVRSDRDGRSQEAVASIGAIRDVVMVQLADLTAAALILRTRQRERDQENQRKPTGHGSGECSARSGNGDI